MKPEMKEDDCHNKVKFISSKMKPFHYCTLENFCVLSNPDITGILKKIIPTRPVNCGYTFDSL